MRSVIYFFSLLLISLSPLPAQESPPPFPVNEERAAYYNEQMTAAEPDEGRFLQSFLYMLFILGLLVGFLFILSWFVKRMMGARMLQQNVESDIKILERRSLTQKSHVYMLEIMGRCVVIAESVNGVTRLAEFPLEENSGKRSSKEFSL